MPTVQVTPATPDLLQDVANTLGKARKVVVVTGAGISTNSGIPDFRSENGLYSLIQAQFERAAASRPQGGVEDESNDFDISDRPTKRRRVSIEPTTQVSTPIDNVSTDKTDDRNSGHSSAKDEQAHGTDGFLLRIDGNGALKQDVDSSSSRPQILELRPPLPRHLTQCSTRSSTSQDSVFSAPQSSATSIQTEDTTDSSTKSHQDRPMASSTPKRILLGETVISSPLSSPPPVLFDPYENNVRSTQESSRPSSEFSDASDAEDFQQSLDFLSSQTSNPSLRNMKGRDLFDSNIWADPLKTSVFYRFATSLRQKVREVQPTTTHHFIAQLRNVGKLARVYTQNIDEIEKKIGLSTDLRSGAGNKRRKSAKQQPLLSGSEKEAKENMDQSKVEEDSPTGGKTEGNQPASQASEETEHVRPRPSLTPDKGVECVFLHGSLHSLRCFVCGKLCDWDEDDRESRTLSGEQPECPHCAGATAARQEKGKRALGVGKLRPDIVLYGEEHPQSDLISPIVQYDLSAGPDLLLVLGTSLRVHGLKVMVKEFAKAVHNKGGKVVFINFTKPSESVWGDVIDYWIEWDCDAWVTDLKGRKPHLWLSPEEKQEQEKQKREALAERRRETLLKRENSNDKKRDSLGEKRRQTIETSKPRAPPKNPSAMRNDYGCGAYVVYDIFQTLAKIGDRPFDNLGHPRPSILPEPPPPRPLPPALPQLAPAPTALPSALPPAPPPAPPAAPPAALPAVPPTTLIEDVKPEKQVPVVKAKRKPRKSAPAILSSRAKLGSDSRPAIKTRYYFSDAKKFKKTPVPPPVIPKLSPAPLLLQPQLQPQPQPQPQLQSEPQPQPQPQSQSQSQSQPQSQLSSQKQEEHGRTTPSQDSSTSIGATIKSHPRRRKRKEIYEGPIVRPAPPKPRRAVRQPPAIPPPLPHPPTTITASSINASAPRVKQGGFMATTTTDYLSPEGGITLAPIRPSAETSTPAAATIKCLEPTPVVSPPSPLAYSVPAPAPAPIAMATSNIPRRRLFSPYPYPSHPMLYSDPLVGLRYGADYSGADLGRDTRGLKLGERLVSVPVPPPAGAVAVVVKDATPSPSDQLQREQWEAAASLMSLGIHS